MQKYEKMMIYKKKNIVFSITLPVESTVREEMRKKA